MKKTRKLAVGGIAGLIGLAGCATMEEAGPDIARLVLGGNAFANNALTLEQRNALAYAAADLQRHSVARAGRSNVQQNVNVYGNGGIYQSKLTRIDNITGDFQTNRTGIGFKTTVEAGTDSLNKPLSLAFYLMHENGTPVMDRDGNCRAQDGQVVFESNVFTPQQPGFYFVDTLAIYDQFDMTSVGQHPLAFKLVLYDRSNGTWKQIDRFQPMRIVYNKKS